jgi:hypothetical protein
LGCEVECVEHSMPYWDVFQGFMLHSDDNYSMSNYDSLSNHYSCSYLWFFEVSVHQFWQGLGCEVECVEHSMPDWAM